MNEYTAYQISKLVNISVPAVHKRAKLKKWRCTERPNQKGGGVCKAYLVESMDDDFRLRIATAEARQRQAQRQDSPAADFSQEQVDIALAKADLLRHYLAALKKAPWGKKKQARRDFMRAYNSGLVLPQLFAAIGKTSWKTIEGWKRQVRDSGDTLNLADRRGFCRKGRSRIGDKQAEILLRCVLQPNRPLVSEAIRVARSVMHTSGVADGFSDATYRRWLSDWKARNFDLWVFTRQGAKAWNDKAAYYIERDYSRINVGDILVADGHKLNFEIISPFTGKPKRMILIVWKDMKSNFPLGWEIMPTENTQAIAAALRRAILRLGKYPAVAYLDNGKAFAGRFFNGADLEQAGFSGLFERLGIRTIFAWPYHGQSKTVERFFGTFAELERLAPTYVGTSIDKKPPRMLRGEKLHHRLHHELTGGAGITLEQAHRAIASWFDQYAARPQRGHLNGAAPAEVFAAGKGPGVNPAELQYLMMAVQIRHIRRNGIHFMGQNYYHSELYGRRHPVTVRYDLQDTSAIYVFENSGTFICAAAPTDKVHPAAAILGDDDDRRRLAEHIRRKKDQEKAASVSARAFLEAEILPAQRRQMAAIGIEPQSTKKPMAKVRQLPLDEKRIAAEVAELEKLNAAAADDAAADLDIDHLSAAEIFARLAELGEMARYKKLVELDAAGVLIPKHFSAFMTYFEQTSKFRAHAEQLEAHRVEAVLAYQCQDHQRGFPCQKSS